MYFFVCLKKDKNRKMPKMLTLSLRLSITDNFSSASLFHPPTGSTGDPVEPAGGWSLSGTETWASLCCCKFIRFLRGKILKLKILWHNDDDTEFPASLQAVHAGNIQLSHQSSLEDDDLEVGSKAPLLDFTHWRVQRDPPTVSAKRLPC